MSTDTPRTDSVMKQYQSIGLDDSRPTMTDLSRQLERELAAETEKVKRLREALEKLVERNYQYNGVEARARFGSHDEAVSTVNHARATLEATK